MNKTIVILASLLSLNALACPNLSGRFLCKDFDNGLDQDVTIAQSAVAGGVAYQMTIVTKDETESRTYTADGVTRPVVDPNFTARNETSTCVGNDLKVHIVGTTKNGEALDAIVTVNINANGDMYDSYIGTLGNKSLSFEETCERQ